MTARKVGTAYARALNKYANAFSRQIVNEDAGVPNKLCEHDTKMTADALEDARAAFRALSPEDQHIARMSMSDFHANRAIVNAMSEKDYE